MRQSAKFGLVTLAAPAWLEVVPQVWPRLPGYFLPGVLPKPLTAIAIPFFVISINLEQRPGQTGSRILRWFTGAALGSCAGLIGWEFVQQAGRRRVFDWSDIFATRLGGALAVRIARRMVGRQAGRQPLAHSALLVREEAVRGGDEPW